MGESSPPKMRQAIFVVTLIFFINLTQTMEDQPLTLFQQPQKKLEKFIKRRDLSGIKEFNEHLFKLPAPQQVVAELETPWLRSRHDRNGRRDDP